MKSLKIISALACVIITISFSGCGAINADDITNQIEEAVENFTLYDEATEDTTEPETETITEKETEAVTEKETETATEKTTKTTKKSTISKTVKHRTGKAIKGVSDKNIDDLHFTFYDSVRNDTTGNWRAIVLAEASFEPGKYALSAYNNYSDSSDTVLGIFNLTTKTSTRINDYGEFLDVSIYEYLSGEEHDADKMFSGDLYNEYWIYKDNGDIEKIQ